MLERKSCSNELLDNVGAALLCRRRCARLPVPLHSLRFAFDSWHWWDAVAIDQWLAYVLPPPCGRCHSHPGLHLNLRFHVGPICAFNDDRRRDDDAGSDSDDDPFVNRWRYLLPGRLFSCTALWTLCVAFCRLALPRINAVDLPFLDTMRLTALSDSGRSIQWLISSCPRLADLTLEALWNLKRVSVLNKVSADSPSAAATTSGLCKPLSGEAEFANLTRFLEEISNTKHLHLHHGGLQSRFFDAGFPLFSRLTRLTLQGCIGSSNATVGRILEQTPNLEIPSLLMWESQKGKADRRVAVFDEIKEPIFSLPCLRTRVREISVEDYEGSMPEKMLVELLLRNALVLERLQVVFTEGLSSVQKNSLEVQMGRWGVANSEKVFM
ncbi:hypothetical protein ACQ4PT_022665 [Festuca glaucescens]